MAMCWNRRSRQVTCVYTVVRCRQYETRICRPKNFFRTWINSSSNHKASNITDHTSSEPHKAAMMYFCTFICQVTLWSDKVQAVIKVIFIPETEEW